jgi:hypothetical protein
MLTKKIAKDVQPNFNEAELESRQRWQAEESARKSLARELGLKLIQQLDLHEQVRQLGEINYKLQELQRERYKTLHNIAVELDRRLDGLR